MDLLKSIYDPKAIVDKFVKSIPKHGIIVSPGKEKPFSKPKNLVFPIICKTFDGGRLVSDNIKSISQLIAHYNGSFFVKRIFVDPDFKNEVDQIVSEIGDPIDIKKDLSDKEEDVARMGAPKRSVDKGRA